MTRAHVLVSFSRDEARRLLDNGPRRDLLEVAHLAGAEVAYRPGERPRGAAGKLLGAHVRQAFALARRLRRGDTVLADGEHTGLPLLVFSALLFRRPTHVAVIGHLLTKWWKLPLLAVATRTGTRGTLLLHSAEQERRVGRWAGGRWAVKVVPYQVDTEYWTPDPACPREGRPLVLAVGAENRDYAVLCEAVAGLDADVVVGAGSHWARTAAGAGHAANVEFLREPLPFHQLRELYRRASVVAVPLTEVPNQSGVTVILEAMSCAVPVVVTATSGQRECITGPLVTAGGEIAESPAPGRGPAAALGEAVADLQPTGLYVPPSDAAALRRALSLLLADAPLRWRMGNAARETAVAHFGTDRFVKTLVAGLQGDTLEAAR